ncbi:MAG: NlpC/P60 family protein [Pseudomonadota bacterium]
MTKTVFRFLAFAALGLAFAQGALAYQFQRFNNPPRTVVNSDAGNWRATYTDGAITVRHWGPNRTFSEPIQSGITGGTQTVTHNSYIRVMATPWPSGGIPTAAQVDALLASTGPDVLAVAMEYIYGAPVVKVPDASAYTGQRWVSGGTSYGPDVGGDFNDHLGISWNYGASYGGSDNNEDDEYGRLDCSGFVRMVFGYRMGVPLAKGGYDRPGVAIPRLSAKQAGSEGMGVWIIPNTGVKPTNFGNLTYGDLVFFDSDDSDPGVIDHVGIYLGVDNQGNDRVINSRNSLQGPTFKDPASGSNPSILQGNGWMGGGFRAARRL